MPDNQFPAFATGVGANVIDIATYLANAIIGTGYESGIAQSAYLNRTWRQSQFFAAAWAKLIVDVLAQDALDDGDLAGLCDQLMALVQQMSTTTPARTVTSSADFTATLSDGIIFFNRTSGLVAQQTVTLPNGMAIGQKLEVFDVVGNFNANPVKVTPPAGSIAGQPSWTFNEDYDHGVVAYSGSNLYGIGR